MYNTMLNSGIKPRSRFLSQNIVLLLGNSDFELDRVRTSVVKSVHFHLVALLLHVFLSTFPVAAAEEAVFSFMFISMNKQETEAFSLALKIHHFY